MTMNKILIGVALTTSAFAGLVPVSPFVNPHGSLSLQVGAATPLYGSPNAGGLANLNFGGSNLLSSLVRDNGFMIGNDSSTFASNGTVDNQGFGSYYTVNNVSSNGGQLQVAGSYSAGSANIGYTRSYSYMPSSIGGAADVLVETISVVNNGTAAVSGLRAWGAMNLNNANGSAATVNTTNWNGNSASAPTIATVTGNGFSMVMGTNSADPNFRAGFLSVQGGGMMMNYGGGYATSSNISQFFGNFTAGGAVPDFFNLYAGNASTAQDRASAYGYNFDLLNAGMSAQIQIFYVFSGNQISAQQAFSSISPFGPPPPVLIGNNTGVPEPGTWVMLGSALVAGWTVRRRRKAA